MAKSTFELFNTGTMSGVTPGTQTRRFQRLRLSPIGASAGEGDDTWALLAWQGDRIEDDEGQTYALHLRAEAGETWAADPALVLVDTPAIDLPGVLETSLAEAGWRMKACGSCRWLSTPATLNPDGIPTGICRWRANDREPHAAINLIDGQSALALACPHWSEGDLRSRAQTELEPLRADLDLSGLAEKVDSSDEHGIGARLKRWIGRNERAADNGPSWRSQLEADGSNVGTEACLACQGRVAKLGSVSATSSEGDRQAYSIWRCRRCFSAFLGCWIDRWARLDSLETDERLFRLAPAEAAEMLARIDSTHQSDLAAPSDWFDAFVQSREPISHTVKHGR